MSGIVKVRGCCPMGCGETLFLAPGGDIWCGPDCPNPTAAACILADSETGHIVVLREEGFSIRHPLRERLDGEPFDCALHRYLTGGGARPARPGRYRVLQQANPALPWHFTEVPS